jgi:hypothetical protein
MKGTLEQRRRPNLKPIAVSHILDRQYQQAMERDESVERDDRPDEIDDVS